MKPIETSPDWSPNQTGEEDPLAGIANAPVAGAKKPDGSAPNSRVTDRIDVEHASNQDENTSYPSDSRDAPV